MSQGSIRLIKKLNYVSRPRPQHSQASQCLCDDAESRRSPVPGRVFPVRTETNPISSEFTRKITTDLNLCPQSVIKSCLHIRTSMYRKFNFNNK